MDMISTQTEIVVNDKGIPTGRDRKIQVALNPSVTAQQAVVFQERLMTAKCKLNPQVVTLKQRVETWIQHLGLKPAFCLGVPF
jgi:hypothetical protein